MANVNFKYESAGAVEPIVFDSIISEKNGGAMVANPAFDIKPSTALYEDAESGLLKPIKAYRVVEAVTSDATTIKIAKGSGIASGDIIGYGSKSVASTAVSKTNADYDVVTVSMATAIAKGEVLYQSGSASANSATPIGAPKYLAGDTIYAGEGDALVKVVIGAVVRKETAQIGKDIAGKMKDVTLV